MSTNNELLYLETLVNEMREKEAQAKALQDEIDAVKSLIKDTMDTEGLSEVTTATHNQVQRMRAYKHRQEDAAERIP